MFTNDWVDIRTRQQKQTHAKQNQLTQLNMFSIQQTPVGGQRSKPIVDISHLPNPPLMLIQEDPRTEEEKQQALQRQAETLTQPMFSDDTPLSQAEVTQPTPNNQPSNPPQDPKLMVYLQLVQTQQEQLTTTWIDKTYQKKFTNLLPNCILNAIVVGLTSHEIDAALQIGQVLGQQLTNQVEPATPPISKPISKTHFPRSDHRQGFRKWARQQQITIR